MHDAISHSISKFFAAVLASAILFSNVSGAAGSAGSSSVTLPMQEYLDLRKQSEKTNLTSIQTVKISGDYGQNLELKVQGVVSGRAESVVLISDATNLEILDCSGSAVITRTPTEILLLPLADRFNMGCKMQFKTWQENAFVIRNALSVQASANNADIQMEDQEEGRLLHFYRRMRSLAAPGGPVQEPSVTGRYRLTVKSDEVQFEYQFSIYNPNSSVFTLTLPKKNQEILQKISTNLEHSEKDAGVTAQLPPGESQMIWRGRLTGDGFVPTFTKGRQMLLFENDPLLQVNVTGAQKKISLQDVGISPHFTGAQAFLMEKTDHLKWTAKEVQVFEGLQFTVQNANYRFFWSPSTSALGEATFSIDNQGLAEIPLPLEARVRYLEVDGVPQILAKNSNGELLLRVPQGNAHQVFLQFEPTSKGSRGLASLTSPLPQLQSVTSESQVQLFVPENYDLIFASGLGEKQSPLRTLQLLAAVIGLLASWKFLRSFSLTRLQKSICSVIVCVLCFWNPGLAVALCFGFLALFFISQRRRWLRVMQTSPRWLQIFSVLATTAAFVFLSTWWLTSSDPRVQPVSLVESSQPQAMTGPAFKGGMLGGRSGALQTNVKNGRMAPAAPMEAQMAMDVATAGTGEAMSAESESESSDPSYQGLPARIHFPDGKFLAEFRTQLVDEKSQPRLFAAVASQIFLQTLQILLIFVLGLTLWRARATLRSEFRRRWLANT